ncbi:hypothetical protein ACFHWD_04430 [Clostridium sp. MT-14]|jgi:hypothetical protein|uniref:hypothetical protein n=1 Tax=Clostridium sp. MT-14 TaxID=3348360 RepID=UPI0035F2C3B0
MTNSFGKRIKLKDGWTEDKIIERLNKALESYVESDFDSEGILYLDIDFRAAKQLFEDLFEGVSFEEYIKYYDAVSVDSCRSCQCDVSGILPFINILGDNVRYSSKQNKFYKDKDMKVSIQIPCNDSMTMVCNKCHSTNTDVFSVHEEAPHEVKITYICNDCGHTVTRIDYLYK